MRLAGFENYLLDVSEGNRFLVMHDGFMRCMEVWSSDEFGNGGDASHERFLAYIGFVWVPFSRRHVRAYKYVRVLEVRKTAFDLNSALVSVGVLEELRKGDTLDSAEIVEVNNFVYDGVVFVPPLCNFLEFACLFVECEAFVLAELIHVRGFSCAWITPIHVDGDLAPFTGLFFDFKLGDVFETFVMFAYEFWVLFGCLF